MSLCVIADSSGNVVTSTNPTGGGAAWTTAHIDPSTVVCGEHRITCPAPTTGVSCPSTQFCVVADPDGNVITSTDPTGGSPAWTLAHVDSQVVPNYLGNTILGLGCVSPNACVATDIGGNAITSTQPDNGAEAWHLSRIDAENPCENGACSPPEPEDVSCQSSGFCTAIDASENVLTSNDPTATQPAWFATRVDPAAGLDAISCPTPLRCFAVARDGSIREGTPVPESTPIKASLRSALSVARRANLRSLRRRHTPGFSFSSPTRGVLQIAWYRLRRSAHRAGRHEKAMLIAASRTTFAATDVSAIKLELTRAGVRLVKHVKRLNLTAEASFLSPGQFPQVTATRRFTLNR